MKSHYRAVVIGGGVVGASVLYHLARAGWSEVALIERAELTAGSTWHAAAGCHTYNSNAALSALQAYTIALYPQIAAESGQDVGLRLTGGISLAATPERWSWLQDEYARHAAACSGMELLTPAEIKRRCPIVDRTGLQGGLFNPLEGRVDPHGTTHAYAIAARRRGAEVILRNRVLDLRPRHGGWDLETEQGPVTAAHVVNAGGLWARRIGWMAGVDLPVVPMEHHYLVTDAVPAIAALDGQMPAVVDLDGSIYLQQERQGLLLGLYEQQPRHWMIDGAPWDYGMDLLPIDIERIEPELAAGFARFPVLAEIGIKRWVNGALTFTPDGNPLVGPVPGLRGYWVACGCMAGFSQAGAIGLALANWMTEGDAGVDTAGMDVSRFGASASAEPDLRAATARFYAHRFAISLGE